MYTITDRIKHMGEHTPKHIATKDPEFEELRAVWYSFSHECREVKLLAKRLQDDLRIVSKSYVDFGMEMERYFLSTSDPMGPLFRSFTFLLRDQMRAVELGVGDTVSAMELALNVNEGFKTRISHRDNIRESMDKWWKYRERGHKEEQKYMDMVKQYEEVNIMLKNELRSLRETTFRFKDVHLRKFISLQKEAYRLLAQGAQELEIGLNIRGPNIGGGGMGVGGGVTSGIVGGSVQPPIMSVVQPISYGGQQQQQQQQQSQFQNYGSGSGISDRGSWSGGGVDREREFRDWEREREWQQKRDSYSAGGIGGFSGGAGGFGGGMHQQQGISGSSSMSQLGNLQLPILSKYLATGGVHTVHVPPATQGSLYPTMGGGFVPPTTLGGANTGSGFSGTTTTPQ